ncbi:MAG: D-inositol-3-phosphate glycosyltransferase [Chroococcopsis gigantea SAG 12.99]|jgi:glycosyltransferase involved in cell wall biosynthesis|nr:glycosyltransferase family 4 protein [Chlorogloea purpurea SAG 13.99]MDV3000273.1 D-inositol-3-phosphate glycosyltransferase [Chroococcopsis gigantea SAG 12.99]
MSLLVNLSFLGQKYTGITTYTKNLFPHLQSLQPTLLTSQLFPEFNCHPAPDNLTQEGGTKANIRRLLWTQLQLPRIYTGRKASLLFSPVPEAPLGNKTRYVVTVYDLIPLRFPKFSPLTFYSRYYLPRVLRGAEHIICISQCTKQDLMDYFGIPGEKMSVIMLGYDRSHFIPLSLPTLPYFLYLGRYDPHKNISRLITAFSRISGDYELILIGAFDPRFTPGLQRQVKELGLESRVKFLDYVSYQDLPRYINQALALVYPSLWEGFGLPLLEAMACGIPVITSNLSSLPEVVGGAGILVNPHETKEITGAMAMIGKDGEARKHFSRLGLQQASKFNWEVTGRQTRDLLGRYL